MYLADVSHLQGMQAQIIKAVLSQALLFGIKDALEACKLQRRQPA